jgi:hypothetical protein
MVYIPIKCTDFISDSCIKQLDYFTFLTRCQSTLSLMHLGRCNSL